MHINEHLYVNTQDYSLWLISIPSHTTNKTNHKKEQEKNTNALMLVHNENFKCQLNYTALLHKPVKCRCRLHDALLHMFSTHRRVCAGNIALG